MSQSATNTTTKMSVPLLDLKAQYATIKDEVFAAVRQVLESQRCIGGPKVAELEEQVAAVSDCKFALGVSSGTDALLNCLMSLDIGPGDEVITTPFTFFATVGGIVRVGARAVFVDIDPKTYNIDPALIAEAITEKTKAIMPVHLFGQMADMDPIMEVAERHGLAVIEDAAQSITGTYKGKKAGSIGTAGCFSFFPSKNLGGAGDAGCIVTNDEQLYNRMKVMRNHGASPKYYHKFVGGNFRLDAIQAAILLVKLPYLDGWCEARRQTASYYDEKFRDTVVRTPFINPDCVSVYNQYVVRVPAGSPARDAARRPPQGVLRTADNRDELAGYLKERGVASEIYYPLPMHLQECFGYLGYKPGDFPESERAAKEVLAIPVYPELTDRMKDYVVDTVTAFWCGGDS